MTPNYYELLKVNQVATKAEIKSAFRRLSKLHHPDVNNGSKESEEKFKLLNEGYHILIDLEQRKKYDAKLVAENNLKNKINYKHDKNTNSQNPSRNAVPLSPLFKMAAMVILLVMISEFIKSISNNLKS